MTTFKRCDIHGDRYIYCCLSCIQDERTPSEDLCGHCGLPSTDIVWDACPECFDDLYPWTSRKRKQPAPPIPSFETESTTHAPRKAATSV
jgi:hypothetical protein